MHDEINMIAKRKNRTKKEPFQQIDKKTKMITKPKVFLKDKRFTNCATRTAPSMVSGSLLSSFISRLSIILQVKKNRNIDEVTIVVLHENYLVQGARENAQNLSRRYVSRKK